MTSPVTGLDGSPTNIGSSTRSLKVRSGSLPAVTTTGAEVLGSQDDRLSSRPLSCPISDIMSFQFSQFVPPPLSALPGYAGVLIQERVKNAANIGLVEFAMNWLYRQAGGFRSVPNRVP